MIYFLLNIIKNPNPPYWKILLFLRAAIIFPDKNGRLNSLKKNPQIYHFRCCIYFKLFIFKLSSNVFLEEKFEINKKHFRLSDVCTQFKGKAKESLKITILKHPSD